MMQTVLTNMKTLLITRKISLMKTKTLVFKVTP